MTTDSQNSTFLVETINELERSLAEANKKVEQLTNENVKLKTKNRENQILNDLEKAFYNCGGKTGKDDDGYSYFDLLRDRAMKHIQMDDAGKVTIIDPLDDMPLKTAKGRFFSAEDLMIKLRSSGTTACLFNNGNSATINPRDFGIDATREALRQIKDPAARLARARELGIK